MIILSNSVLAVLFIVNLLSPYSYQFQSLPILQSVELPWGEVIWQAREDATVWFYIGAVILYLMIIYSMYAFGRMYWNKRTSFALWMFLATLFLFVASIYGLFTRLALTDLPLSGNLPLIIMAVVMSLAITREIRRQQEELQLTIQKNEVFQKAILDYAGHAIISGTPEGIITSFNPVAERMLGYTAAEMIGKLTPEVFHDPAEVIQRAQEFSAELGTAIAPGFEVFVAKARRNLPNEHEWTYIRKDGSRFPVLLTVTALHDNSGEINGFLGLAVDISERKRAEISLLASEQRLKQQQDALIELAHHQEYAAEHIERVVAATTETVTRTLQVASTSVWQMDQENKSLTCLDLFDSKSNRHSNHRQFEETSYSADLSILAQNKAIAMNDIRSTPALREVTDSYKQPAGNKAMLQAPLQRAGMMTGVLSCEHADETRSWTTDEQNFANAVANFLSLCMELHDHQHTSEELMLHRDHLEEMVNERTTALKTANAELEAFTYSVSHDLRAPLRSIDGFANILEEDYTEVLDDTAQGYLRRIRNGIQNMGKLIDGLLQLSRVNRADLLFSRVDLSKLASDIVSDLRTDAPHRQVDIRIAADLVTLGDKNLLHIVLTNLLSNAWKYTSQTKNARIEFDKQLVNGVTTFYIRDNGVGFNMEYAHKLFVAFQRLHGIEFPGAGVGLATVARVIERHRGRVWAAAEVDMGAVFYFTTNENK